MLLPKDFVFNHVQLGQDSCSTKEDRQDCKINDILSFILTYVLVSVLMSNLQFWN
jgi:hypothetical protein